MPKIYFVSGKTLEISEYEFSRITPKLQHGGIRLLRTAKGNLIPLNSTTIELIEKESSGDMFEHPLAQKPLEDIKPEPKEEEVQTIAEEPVHAAVQVIEDKMEKAQTESEEQDEVQESPEPKPVIEEQKEQKPETEQQRQDRMMAELIEKSNCLHPRELLEMKFQATKAGNRYFPVCKFCGYRHRYISIKKIKSGMITDWTMDDIVTALPYQEK